MKFILLLARALIVILQRSLYILTLRQLPPFASVAVIIRKDNKYLMVKRGDGRGYGLPGGYIKLHETAEEAACRETFEETGFIIELQGVRNILSGRARGTIVRAVDIIYNATITGGALRPSLEGMPCWVDLKEIKDEIAFDYAKLFDELAD